MEWLERVIIPMRRVWIVAVARLRTRRTGLGGLRQEVSTCEYEDVHVMWEMVSKTGTSERKPHVWDGIFGWAPCNLRC
ncbi:uncharacterized protein LOC120274849 [Dioscorea cayenensis subsp. rotundata]|uniref:Uncharacterized protein LOC120274849 n=1 Tax=Dioscorea cayennensis subsp. rotundata TaxID=55577 RepID=A0AB40CF40_DIOCR|nr:uncharacterized protein LOC120274849 [Dioscorea cayenensis subsp. rotundata]